MVPQQCLLLLTMLCSLAVVPHSIIPFCASYNWINQPRQGHGLMSVSVAGSQRQPRFCCKGSEPSAEIGFHQKTSYSTWSLCLSQTCLNFLCKAEKEPQEPHSSVRAPLEPAELAMRWPSPWWGAKGRTGRFPSPQWYWWHCTPAPRL